MQCAISFLRATKIKLYKYCAIIFFKYVATVHHRKLSFYLNCTYSRYNKTWQIKKIYMYCIQCTYRSFSVDPSSIWINLGIKPPTLALMYRIYILFCGMNWMASPPLHQLACVAQLVERLPCKQMVGGSNPLQAIL